MIPMLSAKKRAVNADKGKVFRFEWILLLCLVFACTAGQAFGDTYFEKAQKSFAKQKYSKARRYLEKSLEKNPEDFKASCLLAETYAARKSYKVAVNHYKKILEKHPGNVSVLSALGSVYQRGEYYNDAVDVYNVVLEKEPDNVQALYLLGMNKALGMNLNEAYEVYRNLKKKDAKLAASLLHQIQGY